jgi:ADP-ribosylglycohydrolase
MGTVDQPAGASAGAHALTRSLPAGLIGPWHAEPARFAAEIAATTHAAEATDAAALSAALVAGLAQARGVAEAADLARQDSAPSTPGKADAALVVALAAARSQPRQAALLADLAPDARARSALAGGVYVAASFPDRRQMRDALLFAASAGDGGHVATVTGALLGTAHGVDALPVEWVSRLELAWVADVLAHDLVNEFTDSPSGSEYTPAPDPHWWDRYPGW